jgi:hypothetical protein
MMPEATIDHLISLIVLLGALLLFIGLFNQTAQTAILYQRNRYLATKCSDLLDNMMLNPGSPSNGTLFWGKSNCALGSFGLQDPEFTQYELSPFSLMRLNYSLGEPVYYSETDEYYSNNTVGLGQSLLMSFNEVINYTTATELLGINGTYGFSLTIAPIITVAISEVQRSQLNLTVMVTGNGYPLADANLSYCLVTVLGQDTCPAYTIVSGTSITNGQGQAALSFPDIDGTKESYALIVYAQHSGLIGTGHYQRMLYDGDYVIPFVEDFDNRSGRVLVADSQDVFPGYGPSMPISYNATFVLLAQDFTVREMPLDNSTGTIDSSSGKPYGNITISTDNPGILVIAYEKDKDDSGIVLMPWGTSSMSFPVVFGGNPLEKEWIATDIRQVIINGIAYQATLGLWSLEGYQVVS